MQINYEIVFIIKPADINKIEETLDRINNVVISEDSEIYFSDRIGIRKLAYEIKNNKEGYYYYAKIKTDSSNLKAKENISIKINTIKEILKHIIIKLEDE